MVISIITNDLKRLVFIMSNAVIRKNISTVSAANRNSLCGLYSAVFCERIRIKSRVQPHNRQGVLFFNNCGHGNCNKYTNAEIISREKMRVPPTAMFHRRYCSIFIGKSSKFFQICKCVFHFIGCTCKGATPIDSDQCCNY